MPATSLSFRSRSETAKRSRISSGVVLCSTTQPAVCQLVKLMFGSDDEHFRLLNESAHEVVFSCQSALEICEIVDGGIDVSREPRLHIGQGVDNVTETDRTNDEQIDIATGLRLGSGDRAVHKGHLDAIGERRE